MSPMRPHDGGLLYRLGVPLGAARGPLPSRCGAARQRARRGRPGDIEEPGRAKRLPATVGVGLDAPGIQPATDEMKPVEILIRDARQHGTPERGGSREGSIRGRKLNAKARGVGVARPAQLNGAIRHVGAGLGAALHRHRHGGRLQRRALVLCPGRDAGEDERRNQHGDERAAQQCRHQPGRSPGGDRGAGRCRFLGCLGECESERRQWRLQPAQQLGVVCLTPPGMRQEVRPDAADPGPELACALRGGVGEGVGLTDQVFERGIDLVVGGGNGNTEVVIVVSVSIHGLGRLVGLSPLSVTGVRALSARTATTGAR
jgi:hypothetical protein